MIDKNKIEIKVQPKSYYYFNMLKSKLYKILKPIIFILVAISTLYIGFYVLLFFILVIGFFYFINSIKNKL